MKKALVIAVLALGTVAGFSQGQVSFRNNDPYQTAAVTAANGHADRLVYYTDNTTLLTGTNWYTQLFYATGNNVASGSLTVLAATDVPSKFRTAGVADGTWSGSTKTLSTVPQNTALTLQVRVWDGSLYSDYATAANPASLPAGPHITGASATFNFTTPTGAPPPTAGLYMEGLQSFTLQAAPEPSTIALGVLGAASLLFVRRRK